MKKYFNFGKINLYETGKRYLVTVRMEYTDSKFSVCGDVWNTRKTDIVMGGQCLDEIAKYVKNPTFKEIYRLWKLYHLNDMKAGTPEQEKAVREWKEQGNEYDYRIACEYLKAIGLYEVEYEGKPYKYGHSWLFEAIPEEDEKIIYKLLNDPKAYDSEYGCKNN